MGSEPRLVALIRDEVEASPDRRITFARFMERALGEPGLGYYATSALRPTRSGDFLTAPELHPLFGRCIGRALTAAWLDLGSPAPFGVREHGAGRGTLRDTVLAGLVADSSGLADAVVWQPVDLPGRHPDPDGPVGTGAVLANEYLDALPVHCLVVREGALRERWVTWRDDRFDWAEGDLSSPALAGPVAAAGVALQEGQSLEVRPAVATWVAEVARSLTRGIVVVIDYGHEPAELYGRRRMAGTLLTYRGHAVGDDPFEAVGRQDMTAHVDLGELRQAASANGLQPIVDTSLAQYLADLGLGDLLSALGRDPATEPQAYVDARASVLRLLDPRHLGGQRVLAFARR
jgi:SAM-dependent MidA family methyltransferase